MKARGGLLPETRALLHRHGLRPQRSRGQHFLVDAGVRDRIVAAADIQPGETIVEIGPGTGVLTEGLLAAGACVLAVEVDRGLARALRERFAGRVDLTVAEADALQFDFAGGLAARPTAGARVVANIPYNITSPLVLRLLALPGLFAALVLMVQREVAERLCASPGQKAYGAFSVACQYRARVSTLMVIPPTAFHPPPEVESALVRFDPWDRPPVACADSDRLFRVVRAAFGQRRKTLRNALERGGWAAGTVQEACAREGIDGGRRGETLSLAEFARLSDALGGEAPGLCSGDEEGRA
jgi:16S rRNA (adenine1518-N6/adenine1519-N6)-dimethyltransferase